MLRCLAVRPPWSALVLVAVAACGEGRPAGSGPPSGPVLASEIREAGALYAEYAALVGTARLRHFEDGVTVRGMIVALEDHGADGGGLVGRLAAKGGDVVLRFADDASELRARGAGELTARCQVDGLVDRTLFLGACVASAQP